MSLKRMAERFLNLQIQVENRAHNSVRTLIFSVCVTNCDMWIQIEDARAAMALYRKIEHRWELDMKTHKNSLQTTKTNQKSSNKTEP